MARTGQSPDRPSVTRTGGVGYHALRGLIRSVEAVCADARVTGLEHFPRTGGVLLVSNHVSIADPVVLISASPRPLVFMAKEELYRRAFARLFFRVWGGAFPVRRGQSDIRAVRDALHVLHSGLPLLVFPEGTRHPEGLGRGLPGVSYLAKHANCPVLPVAVIGTEHIRGLGDLRRHPPFEVRFGEPFSIADVGGDASGILNQVMGRIAALLPPERRGIYREEPEACTQ